MIIRTASAFIPLFFISNHPEKNQKYGEVQRGYEQGELKTKDFLKLPES